MIALLVGLVCVPMARSEEPTGTVVFVGVWDRSLPLIDKASRETGVPSVAVSPAELAARPKVLDGAQVLFVLNVNPDEVGKMVEVVRAAKQRNPKLEVLALDKRDVHANLAKADLLRTDPKVAPYWRANGLVNLKRLLAYTAATYLGRPAEVEPPVPIPDAGYYDAARAAEPFDSFDAYRTFKRGRKRWVDGGPVAVLLIHQSFWITEDTKVINAQVAALEKRGVNVAVVFGDTHDRIGKLILDAKPDLLIEDRHGGSWPKDALETLDVPYLRPISMLGSTVEEWKADPRGLAHRDVGNFMTVQESKGTVEPVVVGGLRANVQGFKAHDPIPDRVERFADRAKQWLDLRKKANAGKKLAVVYYNKSLGKDDLLRGSPTGAFLDGPASLLRFLPRLKDAGYTLGPLPKTPEELLGWVKARGRNVGPWAQGELDAMVASGDVTMIPLTKYQQWFDTKLTEANRKAVLDRHGPAPGKLMVTRVGGQPHIVLPGIRSGNVLLTPQPERGEKQDDKLIHSRDVPPPHNYLAFYWWLEEEYKADAVVHWGTHGTLELLPGKEAGLSSECWGDVCVGRLPVVNLWIMDNLGEATLSRRRSYATLVDHMVPALVNAGLTDDLRQLHDEIDKFDGLEPGLLKEEFRKKVTAGARATGTAHTLGLDASKTLADADIGKLAEYLHDVYEATTPTKLHVLGTPPPDTDVPAYMVNILRRPFLDHLADVLPVPKEEDRFPGDKYKWLRTKAEELLRAVLIENRPPPFRLSMSLERDLTTAREVLDKLRQADAEIVGLLHALDGKFVRPGPGPDPIRNPGCLPGGRNLYALNPEEVPTKPSWEVAVKLVDDLVRTKSPRKVGIDLNGLDTMRDFGVAEAQAMYLMGVRPVWDAQNLAVDVELIPRAALNRPRIDVFVAMGGMYKENFPTRVKLLDKAVRLASAADEPDNGVRQGTVRLEKQLLDRGFAGSKAKEFCHARIFGAKPGNMSGTGILYLVPRSGVWEKTEEIADVYVDHMSYAYTGNVWGEKIEGLYDEAIQGTDVVVRVWASNMTSPLSNHHVYEYMGGMSMAVKKFTGKTPVALIADVRDPDRGRVRQFEEVLATCFRSELLNRKWVEGMKGHGYAGAGHMSELVKNTFGWSVTRPGSVTQQTWDDIQAVYIKDKFGVGMKAYFEASNPHALQEILATLMEAERVGAWKCDEATRRDLATQYARSVVAHGDSAGLVSGGNLKLQSVVSALLTAPGDPAMAALADSYKSALANSARPAAGSSTASAPASAESPTVTGNEMRPTQGPTAGRDQTWIGLAVGGAALVLVVGGAIRRRRVA
ncbi:MAG: cobalt chelatase [Planctomycetaceae bacterium]|nr:cobalt chelatase [Planctomycetaceae bacterium]